MVMITEHFFTFFFFFLYLQIGGKMTSIDLLQLASALDETAQLIRSSMPPVSWLQF